MRAIWYFGDGTTGYEWNPLHRYKAPGVYTVIVRVVNDGQDDSSNVYGTPEYGLGEYKGIYTPSVDFVGTPLEGVVPLAVQFTLSADGLGFRERVDYVRVHDWQYGGGGLHVSRTTQCLRRSLTPSQGVGWAEFGGDYWPMPEARVGTVKIVDSEDVVRQLVFDTKTSRVVEVGIRDVFVDLIGEYQDGYEISNYIVFPEYTGSAEHFFLESLQHHAHFRPFNSLNPVYRSNFEVQDDLIKDGETLPCLTAKDIPIDGEITHKRHREAHRWQRMLTMATSEYKLVRVRDYYVARDRSPLPPDREMTEDGYILLLSDTSTHLGRDELNPLRNQATGGNFTGSYLALARGPDGRDNSAMTFLDTQGLTGEVDVSLSGDFGVMVWISSLLGDTSTIFDQVNGFSMVITRVGSAYQVTFEGVTADLSWTGSGWVHIAAERVGNLVRIYENKSMILSQPLDPVAYNGAIRIMRNTGGTIADAKQLNGQISSGAVEFYYDDVIDNEGRLTMPLF